ncbi:MAG: hypothetical protein LBD69_02895 [Puniceicoccales bacterium]|jgi:hypothetical protein|nr:hypothetical protein [Puniceicoccales bacterium]
MFKFVTFMAAYCLVGYRLILACGFPVSTTCPYESLPPHIRNLHARLFYAASLAGLEREEEKEKNHFVCAFVIYFKDGTYTEIPVSEKLFPVAEKSLVRKIARSQHVPLYHEDWWVFCGSEQPSFSPCATLMNLWTLWYNQQKTSLENQKATDTENFYCMLKNPGTQYPPAKDAFLAVLRKYFYKLYNRGKQQAVGQIRPQTFIRPNDSEAWAIWFLHTYCKRIADLAKERQRKRKIVRIELHGHSTQDMCPFCFTHMNLLQWLANNNPVGMDHCFGNLRFQLYIDGNVPITLFISSALQFQDSSSSWFHEFIRSQEGYRLQSVNQFRLLDNRLLNYTLCGEIPTSLAHRLGALMPVFGLYGNHNLRLVQNPDTWLKETQESMLLNALDLKAYKNTLGQPNQFEVQDHVEDKTFKYVYVYFPSSKTKMTWEKQEDKAPKLPYVSGLLSTVSSMLSNTRTNSPMQPTFRR